MAKFSANLGFLWTELPLAQRIAAAAHAGFGAVELHWPYEVPAADVARACAQHRVKLLALNSPLGDTAKGEFGLAALPGREKDFLASMRIAADYASRAGAASVHVMAGLIDPSVVAEARPAFLRNLRAAADIAGEKGLRILLEPLNRRDKPGYFYSTIAPALEIIGELGFPHLRLMFDVYHVAVMEGDVTKKLEAHLASIGHVQIAAVPSRAEPDEGEIDFGHIARALDRLGYEGWIGAEYKPRTTTQEGLGWYDRFRSI